LLLTGMIEINQPSTVNIGVNEMPADNNLDASVPPGEWIALQDVVMKYAQAIDTKDWDLFRTVFVDDIQLTYGEPWGPFDGIDEVVSFVDPFHAPLDGSRHSTTNFRVVAYDGNTAMTRCSVDALLVKADHPDGPFLRVIGAYVDDFVRQPDGWRIKNREFTRLWAEGNPNVAFYEWSRPK